MGGGACCTLTPEVWLPGLFPSSISATVHTVCIRGAGRERLENVNELCVWLRAKSSTKHFFPSPFSTAHRRLRQD